MIAPLPSGNSAEHYRNEAARLRREAKSAQSDSIRRQILEVADGYDTLAKSVDLLSGRKGC